MSALGPFAELANLTNDESRSLFLKGRQDLLRSEVVTAIAEAVRKHVRVDMQEALRLAEGGMAIASRIGDDDAQALACRAKANALYMLGQNRAAVELHDLAITLFKQSGNSVELGRSFSASLQPLSLLGLYDRAYEHASRAREIFASQNDSLRLARLEINFANILHRQDRFGEALLSYRRALGELWPDKDVEGVAVVLHNIAVCLIGLNDSRQAMETYSRAREFCELHTMPLLVAQSDYNIASLYFQRGEYGRAIRSLRTTRDLCQSIGDDHHFALCLMDLAEIYIELNLYDVAASKAGEAFLRFEKLAMGYEAAKCLAYRAIALSRVDGGGEALQLFGNARQRFIREDNRAWPFVIDLYQSVLLCDASRFEEARPLCVAALAFFEASAMPGKAILCQLLLARIVLQTGQHDEASRLCLQAIEQAEAIESPNLKFNASALLGKVFEAQGRRREAWTAYEAAQREMETLRSSLGDEGMKIALMANKFEVYERLVSLSLDGAAPSTQPDAAGCIELALRFIEQAKNRSLRDALFGRLQQMAASNGCSETGPDPRVRELREELSWFQRRIEQHHLGPSAGSIEVLKDLHQQARLREQQLLTALREDPASESALYSSKVASLAEIRGALPLNTGLLEFFRVGDRFMVIVVTADQLHLVHLAEAGQVAQSLRLLRFQFERRRMAGAAKQPTAASLEIVHQHLRDLHQGLFAPLGELLRNCRRLVIVPHDLLHDVPFQALTDGDRYVSDLFAISYAPSASILALSAGIPRPASTRSLILGVPDDRAPRILDEVEALAGMLPEPDVYVGEQASVSVLRDKGPSSRYIHIASHGHFRSDSPLFSGVMLGREHLDVYDLYQLRLPAELVTLSGCGTGLNVLAKGDEQLGIERGLLYAGAQCLLLTMWDVHDGSAAAFIRLFYEGLTAHGDKGVALRQAQRRLREQYPHPYDWAPFVLVGNA